MAFDGGGEQELLQRVPWFGVGFALLNHVYCDSHVIIGISNLGFMAIQYKKQSKRPFFFLFFFFVLFLFSEGEGRVSQKLNRNFMLVVGCVLD